MKIIKKERFIVTNYAAIIIMNIDDDNDMIVATISEQNLKSPHHINQ